MGQINYYWVKAMNMAGASGLGAPDIGYRTIRDILFAENWESGIAADVWKLWGDPQPVSREGEGRNGGKGYDANGDDLVSEWGNLLSDLRSEPAADLGILGEGSRII